RATTRLLRLRRPRPADARRDRRSAEAKVLVRLLGVAGWNPEAGREVVRELLARGESATPALIDALAAPRTPRAARLASAWILGRVGGLYADLALARATADRDPEVARTAARARAHAHGTPSAA